MVKKKEKKGRAGVALLKEWSAKVGGGVKAGRKKGRGFVQRSEWSEGI